VVLSQPFSKAAAEVSTSEIDPMDFDNDVAASQGRFLISRSLFSYLIASFGDYYV